MAPIGQTKKERDNQERSEEGRGNGILTSRRQGARPGMYQEESDGEKGRATKKREVGVSRVEKQREARVRKKKSANLSN